MMLDGIPEALMSPGGVVLVGARCVCSGESLGALFEDPRGGYPLVNVYITIENHHL